MIKHVVLFKLKDNSPEHCKKIKDLMLTMKDNIEDVRDVEVGIDFLHSPRSYDIMLSVYLDGPEYLDKYANHPYHVEHVKAYMAEARTDSVAIDYELD